MNRLHLFCVAQKKIRDDGCCLLKNFTRPNQLYKVFLPVSPFQKKTDILKKQKSQQQNEVTSSLVYFSVTIKFVFAPEFFLPEKNYCFFGKKKKKCKSFPTVEMFYSKSFGKKLKTLRLYASYYEFCLIWRFFLKGFTFALRKQTFFSSFFFLKDFTFFFPKKTFFFSRFLF